MIEVKSRISNVGKVLGGMKLFSCRAMEISIKRRLYERVLKVVWKFPSWDLE